MIIDVTIHDEELKRYLKKSPARADWAAGEAFSMAGGHFKWKLRKDIQAGRIGGPKGSPHPLGKRRKKSLSPLYNLGIWARFRNRKRQGQWRLLIGFLNVPGIKFRFGDKRLTIPAVAKMHENGRRIRVTKKMRGMIGGRSAAEGFKPLKKSTRYLNIPARPMVGPFYNREKNNIQKYVRKRFFEKFFSKQRPDLGV